MNANEVVAKSRAGVLGPPARHCHFSHPIDDVNMAQSTIDAYPMARPLAVIFATTPLAALQKPAYAFKGY